MALVLFACFKRIRTPLKLVIPLSSRIYGYTKYAISTKVITLDFVELSRIDTGMTH